MFTFPATTTLLRSTLIVRFGGGTATEDAAVLLDEAKELRPRQAQIAGAAKHPLGCNSEKAPAPLRRDRPSGTRNFVIAVLVPGWEVWRVDVDPVSSHPIVELVLLESSVLRTVISDGRYTPSL